MIDPLSGSSFRIWKKMVLPESSTNFEGRPAIQSFSIIYWNESGARNTPIHAPIVSSLGAYPSPIRISITPERWWSHIWKLVKFSAPPVRKPAFFHSAFTILSPGFPSIR